MVKAKTLKALAEQIGDIDGVEIYGRVVGVRGLMVEIAGPIYAMSVGSRLTIETAATAPAFPARWSASPASCSGDALWRARRRAARLPGRR